ncbi:MAG TPA: hypothetical protein VJ437_00460 [Acidiferrobacterales bacterium]|nr:hypothetical protein [Acidiferrobacterales bacterium]
MASTVRKIDYFAMNVPNRRGEAARILDSLREQGVNLLAFTGFPDKRGAQIDFVPENTAAFKAAARRSKLMLRARKSGFLVQGDDRPGALSRVLDKLAEARINVTAVDAVCAGKNRFGALLWVKQKDVTKAKRALGAR